jgi:hypothetical protein
MPMKLANQLVNLLKEDHAQRTVLKDVNARKATSRMQIEIASSLRNVQPYNVNIF